MHMKLVPVVKALVFDGSSVLILRKWSGRYDLPGGRVKDGECEPKETLMREIDEEIGIDVNIGKRIIDMVTIANTDEGEIVASVYLCKYVGGEIRLSREHTEFWWVPVKEINSSYPKWIQETISKV